MKMKSRNMGRSGWTPCRAWRVAFTLIELLIVVSIISILASIAVPNFVEAQVRAKVARAKADMRSMMTAIQTYRVDHNDAPFRRNTTDSPDSEPPIPELSTRIKHLSVLTTPIAYMTSLPHDIFETNIPYPNNTYEYFDPIQVMWLINSRRLAGQVREFTPGEVSWLVISVGPDGYLGPLSDKHSGTSTPFLLKGTIFYP